MNFLTLFVTFCLVRAKNREGLFGCSHISHSKNRNSVFFTEASLSFGRRIFNGNEEAKRYFHLFGACSRAPKIKKAIFYSECHSFGNLLMTGLCVKMTALKWKRCPFQATRIELCVCIILTRKSLTSI